MPGWLNHTRAIFELLYFASGIAIAVIAFFGLGQLKIGLEQVSISKEVARANAKRESIRYAADQCRYFAETVIPLMTELVKQYHQQKLTFLRSQSSGNQPNQPAFIIQNGEIIPRAYDVSLLDKEWPALSFAAVSYLNALESFAIPFAEGVADEEIGYRETARPFCAGTQEYLPAIFQLRRLNAGRYESIIKLHAMWSNRLAAEAIAPVAGFLEDFVKNVGKDRIKPVGPNFR